MPTLASRFAKTRIAVAVLGQAGGAGWWSSSFLTPTGLEIAKYNFPRGPHLSAVNATTAAAKLLHDERIGKRRCVHLFRLPMADEMLIQQAIKADGFALLTSMPLGRDDAMAVLEAQGTGVISVEPGPVQVGTTDDAFTEVGLTELAKHYFAAFRQNIQSLPYFADTKR
jgi:hypothetical protein